MKHLTVFSNSGEKNQIMKGSSSIRPIALSIIPLLLFLVLTMELYAAINAPGDLDTSFGTDGKVTTDWGLKGIDGGLDIALQNDGKIVVAGVAEPFGGDQDFGIVRYDANGVLDPTFSGDGKVATSMGNALDFATGVVIQPDGKIVVVGTDRSDFVVARYEISGTLDATFGNITGIVKTDFGGQQDIAYDVALDANGKIVVVGSAYPNATDGRDFAIARYNTDGTLDIPFGSGGKQLINFGGNASNETAFALAIQKDGKIVLAGGFDNQFALARLEATGALDNSFDGNGKVTSSILGVTEAHGVAIQSDGKIIAAGEANENFALVRYDTDGAEDTSFGTDGIVLTDFNNGVDSANDVVIDGNGKIVVAGLATLNSVNFALARYESNGNQDNSFGFDGLVATEFSGREDTIGGVVIDTSRKIVAGGVSRASSSADTDFAVARYLSTGDPIDYGVTIVPVADQGSGTAGSTVTYVLRVTNTSFSTKDTYDITVNGNTWAGSAPSSVGPIDAQSSQDVKVMVDIPANAPIGAKDTVVIVATSQGNNAVNATSTLTTESVTVEYGVELTPAAAYSLGLPDTTINYTLRVTNTGMIIDTFSVSVSDNNWPTIAPSSVGPLTPGAGKNIQITVDIPANTMSGAQDSAAVRVSSQGNTAVSASSVLTNESVSATQLFLPLVLKP